MYYEKALCQQNVDVQVMVLKQRNSNTLKNRTDTNSSHNMQHHIKVDKHKSDLDMNSRTNTDDLGSPPPPNSYNGAHTINCIILFFLFLNCIFLF